MKKGQSIVNECTNKECGISHANEHMTKGIKWWSEAVGGTVVEKRRALKNGCRQTDIWSSMTSTKHGTIEELLQTYME